jgi:hypothetical protein
VSAVALIVTGDMEQYGLARSLLSAFPETDFSVQRVDGFTSAKVMWPPPIIAGMQSSIEKYAAAFLAALNPARREPKPDYVFAIEDLELANRLQPDAVVQALRSAVSAELERRRRGMNAATYDKFAAKVKENCSFHLFAPMPEAYFYADRASLQAARCTRPPVLVPGRDVELFETTDSDFLTPPQAPRPSWAIDPALRPYHPKRYLEFLLAPAYYSEAKQGVDALHALTWQTVMKEPEQTLFLRSLFQDLAHALDLEISRFPGMAHPLTSDYRNRNRLLRNC